MGQGLKGSAHTYSQFTDLIFGPLPKTDKVAAMLSLIGNHLEGGFTLFMDNHLGGFMDFDTQFRFLHEKYFPRIAFGPVYLSGRKTNAFCNFLNILGFTNSAE
jgi:hypothetical protein